MQPPPERDEWVRTRSPPPWATPPSSTVPSPSPLPHPQLPSPVRVRVLTMPAPQ